MNLIYQPVEIIFCHAVGDYFLQTDFLAKSRGRNFYHLLIHCVLYTLPFYLAFGITWELLVIFVTHIIIDSMKVKGVIGYKLDQVLHYIVAFALYIV